MQSLVLVKRFQLLDFELNLAIRITPDRYMYSRKKLGGEPNAICEYSFDNYLYMYLQWENKMEIFHWK